jgi:dTDP-4-dehydrorhamnose reductase
MKVMLTGYTGTLAPYVARELKHRGHEVFLWNRGEVSLESLEEIHGLLERQAPDMVLHLATGPETWLWNLVQAVKRRSIPLLFTSSESVFGGTQEGPFTVDAIPEPDNEYGAYKRRCEKIILDGLEDRYFIVRLGWQIGEKPEKNNMLTYLVEKGDMEASTRWIPSTSFMKDTATALADLAEGKDYGIIHLDANDHDRSFHEIASALMMKYHLPVTVTPCETPERNNRLTDPKKRIRSLEETLFQP